MQVDKGAIRHILSGADIMCPGLTSENGIIDETAEQGDIVAITAEGKKHAVGVGEMVMSPQDIIDVNKGIGVKVILYLSDHMWDAKLG